MNNYTIPSSWLNRTLNVTLLGCGGTGSEMIDELFRIHSLLIALGGSGLNVTAYDGDIVSEANIGRQRFWPCDVGHFKAEVLITRLNSFGLTEWQYKNKAFKCKEINPGFTRTTDLLISCVDSPKIRAKIGKKANKLTNHRDMLWLDCGNDAHSGNIILGHLCSRKPEQALPNVFDLYPVLSDMKDNETPSCSTQEALFKQDYGINRSVAREAGNLVWQLLRHGSVDYHGSYVDIRSGSVTPLKVDAALWASFGYQHDTSSSVSITH